MHRIASLSAAVALSSFALTAQCTRPFVPKGGLPTVSSAPGPMAYSDGAETVGKLLVPDGPAPTCGWPLVVHVHSLGATHLQHPTWRQEIASRGYAVWSYDVRGQGAVQLLSPNVGLDMWSIDSLFDLVEQIEFVRTTYPEVSPSVVGIVGKSQGGIHGWMVAAHAGQTITHPQRGTITVPSIDCVVGGEYVAEPSDDRIRGGTLFNAYFLDVVFGPTGGAFRVDTDVHDQVEQFFVAQDPGGLLQAWAGEPVRMFAPGLAQTDVPILYYHAYHDSICGTLPIVERAATLPATTPFRLVSTQIGHSVPDNEQDLRMFRDLGNRWLDRFLWGEANGVDVESRFVSAGLPTDPAQVASSTHVLEHRFDDGDPPPDVGVERWFSDVSGVLATTEPTVPGTTSLEHRVAPALTPTEWVQRPNRSEPSVVLADIPLSEQVFAMPPLANEVELVGSPHVHVAVMADAPAFTVAALLTVQLQGATTESMLTHWGVGVLDAIPGQPRQLEFDLTPVVARLPAGAVLRLRLRNHWLTEAPHQRGFAAVPLFTDSTVTVEHGAGTSATWIDLPLRRMPRPALLVDELELDTAAPRPRTFEVRGGVARAGWSYVLTGSLSGHVPGITFPTGVLPVQFDNLTVLLGQLVGSPELIDFVGVLDADGDATAVLDLSGLGMLPPELVGERMSFSAWVHVSSMNLDGAPTNPVDLFVR